MHGPMHMGECHGTWGVGWKTGMDGPCMDPTWAASTAGCSSSTSVRPGSRGGFYLETKRMSGT